MIENDPRPDLGSLAERREFVRRSVLRANRTIGAILAMVVLTGAVLVFFITKARQSQARAEQAEAENTERLWKASLAQARAENLSTKMGHRDAALQAVRTAALIRPSLELRNEALAALIRPDLVPDRSWDLQRGSFGFNFDPDLRYYLVRYTETDVSLYRMDDNSHVRDFPLPASLALQRKLLGTPISVGDFTFSASGKYTAIRYNGGAVALYETESGQLARVIGLDPITRQHSWPPTFTADDRIMCLAMHGTEGTHLLYDIQAGNVRPMPKLPDGFTYTGGFTNFTRLSPRGDLIAWYSGDVINIYHTATGNLHLSHKAAARVQSLTWDVRGDRFLFACDNFALYSLEIASGRIVQFGDIAVETWVHNFSADGRLLVTSGSDGITRLWDVATARVLCRTTAGRGLVISRSGDRIAWGLPGRKVGVWRIATSPGQRDILGTYKNRSTVWQSDISPDGRLAVWSPPEWAGPDNTARNHSFELIDLESRQLLPFLLPAKHAAGFHPLTQQLWLAGPSGLRLFNLPPSGLPNPDSFLASGTPIPLPKDFTPHSISWNADGQRAVIPGSSKRMLVINPASPDNPLLIENASNSHLSLPGPASPSGTGSIILSPDGRWIVSGRYTMDTRVTIWDATTGKGAAKLDTPNSHITFSRDGRLLLATGFNDATLWETGSWKRLWRKERQPLLSGGSAGAFLPNNKVLAWNRDNTTIDLLSFNGDPVATLQVPDLGFIASIRAPQSSDRLFIGGMEGRMLSLDLAQLRKELAALHLDWPFPPAKSLPAPRPLSSWSPALLSLAPVALAAILGTLALRRQGRLTSEFIEATEVAAQREQELAAEREISDLKSRFVSTVSHEFRTPLGITMSAVELLRHYEDRLPQAEKSRLFDDIHSATRNMAGLMEQVLVLGRADAGKLACRPAPVDLDALVRKVTDETLSATNRKCPVSWAPESDLSGAAADEALLRHIFTNLLHNAVKYSPPGSPVLIAARREGPMAVFSITDHGIGIPDADLPSLFEAFHRGSNVGDLPGTGLGLVITKRCIDLHRGSIHVKSSPDLGSTFTVRIPAWN